jgi:hypothetical protein
MRGQKLGVDSHNSQSAYGSVGWGAARMTRATSILPPAQWPATFLAHVSTNSRSINIGETNIYGDALSNGGVIGSPKQRSWADPG